MQHAQPELSFEPLLTFGITVLFRMSEAQEHVIMHRRVQGWWSEQSVKLLTASQIAGGAYESGQICFQSNEFCHNFEIFAEADRHWSADRCWMTVQMCDSGLKGGKYTQSVFRFTNSKFKASFSLLSTFFLLPPHDGKLPAKNSLQLILNSSTDSQMDSSAVDWDVEFKCLMSNYTEITRTTVRPH